MNKLLVTKDNSSVYSRCGVYLGGIGAGGVEILPNGRFGISHMTNEYLQEIEFEAFFLFQSEGRAGILSTEDLIHSSRILPGVNALRFEECFPQIRLTCEDPAVEIIVQSYFVPGDSESSGLPLIKMTVTSEANITFCFKTFGPARAFQQESLMNHISPDGELALYRFPGGETQFFSSLNFRWFLRTYANLTQTDALMVADAEHTDAVMYGKDGTCLTQADSNYAGAVRHAGIHMTKPDGQAFLLAWHYPNMKDLAGNVIGRRYEGRFASVGEVVDYALEKRKSLEAETAKFMASVFDERIPSFLSGSYSAQLSSMIKASWHDRTGHFGVWEGSPCSCGLQTVDVAYYGSWLYAELFPNLEKSAISLTALSQRENGSIAHAFPAGFMGIDRCERKDCILQYILMAYRNFTITGERETLKGHWPHMLRAFNVVRQMDIDGDGVPDIVGAEQTFDLWSWKGCSIYMATLWMATWQAMRAAGQEVEDDRFEAVADQELKRILHTIEQKLWTGRYYRLWAHEGMCDEACLLDGLSGDWYSRLCGLGGVLPGERVLSHLRTCLKVNRVPVDETYMKVMVSPGEKGMCLINGGYEDGRRTACFHQYEPWTGMEYAFAVHCLLMGLEDDAFQIVRDIYERKRSAGLIWNHMECGGHYFRSMVFGKFFDLYRNNANKYSISSLKEEG